MKDRKMKYIFRPNRNISEDAVIGGFLDEIVSLMAKNEGFKVDEFIYLYEQIEITSFEAGKSRFYTLYILDGPTYEVQLKRLGFQWRINVFTGGISNYEN